MLEQQRTARPIRERPMHESDNGPGAGQRHERGSSQVVSINEGDCPSSSLKLVSDNLPAEDEKQMLSVSLPLFEGPLDLLLHLVREHRLDVFDIPIAFITEKYLDIINHMKVLNLDVAGEFLVMTATLAHIKSRMLLPRPEPEEGEGDLGADTDPREELVRRLLTYQRYREAAASLGKQDILGRDVFSRPSTMCSASVLQEAVEFQPVGVFRLIEVLDNVLTRAKAHVSHEVTRERLSLAERLTEVVQLLAERRRISFREMFGESKSKEVIILSFLALLEMSRLGLARIAQEEAGGDIMLLATEQTGETDISVKDDFS